MVLSDGPGRPGCFILPLNRDLLLWDVPSQPFIKKLEAGAMKISVCLASYNGEKYIAEQIESILKQKEERDSHTRFLDRPSRGTLWNG